MAGEYRGERAPVVGRHGEVAALEERGWREAGPLPVNPAAAHRPAEDPDRVAMPVVGAGIAILLHGAAEFGEHDDYGISPFAAEVLRQRGEALAERAQPVGELAVMAALADMGVPPAEADKGESDVVVA